MSDCAITTSVFSAGANSPSGIPKGWLAEAADQLIDGKRYVGIDATAAATDPTLNTTKGHISNIIHDCANDCEVYGSTYSQAGDGRLKTRTLQKITGIRINITLITVGDCTIQSPEDGQYILPRLPDSNEGMVFGLVVGSQIFSIWLRIGDAGTPDCLSILIQWPPNFPAGFCMRVLRDSQCLPGESGLPYAVWQDLPHVFPMCSLDIPGSFPPFCPEITGWVTVVEFV